MSQMSLFNLQRAGANQWKRDQPFPIRFLAILDVSGTEAVCSRLIFFQMSSCDCVTLSDAIKQHPSCIERFLNTSQWINQQVTQVLDDDEEEIVRPLVLACSVGNEESVRIILAQSNVDVNDVLSGWSAIGVACERATPSILRLLLDRGARPTASDFVTVCSEPESSASRLRCLTMLIENGNDALNSISLEQKSNALCQAAFHKHVDVATMLLDRNFPLNGHGDDIPVILAADGDAIDCLQLLIQRGASVNSRNSSGETALFWCRSAAAARLILNANYADVNGTNRNGQTALHRALSLSQPDLALIELLLDSGLNVNIRDSHNRTALDLASRNPELRAHAELIRSRGGVNGQSCTVM